MGRLDRWGDPVEPTPTDDEIHDRTCVDGFIGGTDGNVVVPCLRCRPHLARRGRRVHERTRR